MGEKNKKVKVINKKKKKENEITYKGK